MEPKELVLDFDDIRRLLPQAYPFILLDRVEELLPGERIVALKNVCGNEWVFPGHFPQKAVYPGVLLLESMAQAGILLLKATLADAEGTFLIASIRSRFLRPVVPGDQVRFTGVAQKIISTGAVFEAQATVDGETAAKAEMTFALR